MTNLKQMESDFDKKIDRVRNQIENILIEEDMMGIVILLGDDGGEARGKRFQYLETSYSVFSCRIAETKDAQVVGDDIIDSTKGEKQFTKQAIAFMSFMIGESQALMARLSKAITMADLISTINNSDEQE